MEPKVLFQDNHLLVLDKPPGLLTQPTEEQEESLEQWGKLWIKKTCSKPGNVFLHAVHRLDKPVSGIVLFARTSKALSRLQEAIRKNLLKKTYLGVITGDLSIHEGEFIDYLSHQQHRAICVTHDNPAGKKSVLNYRVIKTAKPYTLVEISLLTGRYHQIRVQFASRDLPIVGDRKYGSSVSLQLPHTIALHHAQLEIPHPISGSLMRWEASSPNGWPIIV